MTREEAMNILITKCGFSNNTKEILDFGWDETHDKVFYTYDDGSTLYALFHEGVKPILSLYPPGRNYTNTMYYEVPSRWFKSEKDLVSFILDN